MNNKQDVISGPEYRSIVMHSLPLGVMNESIDLLSSQAETKIENQPLHPQQWNVPQELPGVPGQYMLGPTHAYIQNESPQVVADRIYNCLRSHSIASQPSETHQNSLIGEATCGLKFAVNLFSTDSSSGDILLEVQRRTGCSYGFHLVGTAILRAAEGLASKGTIKPRNFQLPSCIPQECMEERKKCIKSDTEIALDLVRSERTDAQLLGLQSLERLSMDEYSASLLHTEDTISTLQSFLAHEQPTCVMKRRALAVLANILKSCKSNDMCSKLKCQTFMERLVSSLKNSATSPHEAFQATRCLQNCFDSLSKSKHQDLALLLSSFNASHHSELEKELQELQSRLRKH